MKNRELIGVSGAKGIIIGKIVRFIPASLNFSKEKVKDKKKEQMRFEQVRKRIIEEWRGISRKWKGSVAALLNAQIMFLEDEEFLKEVARRIKDKGMSAEQAFWTSLENYMQHIDESGNSFFKQRAEEIRLMGKRVVMELQGKKSILPIKKGEILVADELLPFDVLGMQDKKPCGLALEKSGPTSHTIIVARQLQIPTVSGISGLMKSVKDGQEAVIDGWNGKMILNPSPSIKKVQEERIKKQKKILSSIKKKETTKSTDRKKIAVMGNIDTVEQIHIIKENEGQGVGLFRTEVVLWDPTKWWDEDYQTDIYQQGSQEIFPDPLIVRVLDIGGERYIPGYAEKNPFLGLRGIRFLSKEKQILRTQLRAILRASNMGNIRVLLPMVTILEEINAIKKFFERLKKELKIERVNFDPHLSFGIMVEVPSVALMTAKIAPNVDFFSVGTNDLTQYLFGVDRTNPNVAYLYNEFHPAVFKLISSVVKGAHQFRKRVSVCGELASDPLGVVVLMGLGIDELSVHPHEISFVREIIARVEYKKAKDLSREILKETNSIGVKEKAINFLKNYIPEIAELITL